MQPNLRTVGTWSAVLLLPAILIASPAPQTTKAVSAGNQAAIGPLACADSLNDQAGAGCLQASSTATSGLLFPYPGVSNTFTAPAFVGGGAYNNASGGYATIGGGRINTASGIHSTVGGGYGNDASYFYSTVGGGSDNTASGVYSTVGGGQYNIAGNRATVGGGTYNTASGIHSTIGGGLLNTASGSRATVGGGATNTASGSRATVAGGQNNTAQGDYSFAGGRRAKANHNGAFVWGDSVDVDKTSSAVNEFNIYAEGGMRMFAVGQTDPSMVVTPDGDVGVGTANPAFPMHVFANSSVPFFVEGNNNPGLRINNTGEGSSWTIFHANGTDNLQIRDSTSGVARMVVRGSDGRVGIGTTTPGFTLEVNGSAGKPGGGSWSVSSDARLKKNVADLEGALETLLDLRGVTFEYKEPGAINELEGERIGFIAQEVENVLPDWVEDGDDGYKHLTIRGFEALAVEALRELREEKDAEIAAQAEEIAQLRADLDEFRKALGALTSK